MLDSIGWIWLERLLEEERLWLDVAFSTGVGELVRELALEGRGPLFVQSLALQNRER